MYERLNASTPPSPPPSCIPLSRIPPSHAHRCGSTTHLNISHRDCPLNRRNRKPAIGEVQFASAGIITAPCLQPTKEQAEASWSSQSEQIPADQYWPGRPYVTHVKYSDGKPRKYDPMPLPKGKRHRAKFAMPRGTATPGNARQTAQRLSEIFVPDTFVARLLQRTKEYTEFSLKTNPQTEVFRITEADILHWISIILYMGYVKMPSKKDYWPTVEPGDPMSLVEPQHPICTARQMSQRKFQYIWKHIYAIDPKPVVPAADSSQPKVRALSHLDLRCGLSPISMRDPLVGWGGEFFGNLPLQRCFFPHYYLFFTHF